MVVSLVVIVCLAGLGLHLFSPSGDSSSDLYNVIVVGGRAEDNSSLLSVEVLNIGECNQDTNLLVVPSLPEPLTDLSVSYLTESSKVEVCGHEAHGDLTCFSLNNSSTVWERSVLERSARPLRSEEVPSPSLSPVSDRQGAAVI